MMRRWLLAAIALVAVASSHARGAQLASVHVLGTLMPESEEEFEPITTACQAELRSVRAELSECEANPAPRAELRSCRAELVECEADAPVKPSQHQRKALSTPAPTPSLPVPSNTPSISPAPTSEAWFQLAAAVADSSNEEIFVDADVTFPSQSPITVDSDRSVSIVGRSADGGGRVALDGGTLRSRFFVVDGGTLYLTHLNLVNGSAPEPYLYCDRGAGDFSCAGGAILVLDDGQLVMASCDIRGRGRRDGFDARNGGGVAAYGLRITATFDNVTFEGLGSNAGAAVHVDKVSDDGVPMFFTFRHCQFLRNVVVLDGVARFTIYEMYLHFYDCQFLNCEGVALFMDLKGGGGEFRSCEFSDNFSPVTYDETFYNPGAAVVVLGNHHTEIQDCVFENNIGPVGGKGGALSASSSRVTVIDSTFIENVADEGGAVSALAGALLTMINCYARANTNFGLYGGTLSVAGATLVILNSTVTESFSIVAGIGWFRDSAIVIMEHSVFANNGASYHGGFSVAGESSLSMTDCIHRDNVVSVFLAYLFIDDSSTVTALRNLFQNLRAPSIGPVYLRSSTGYFEDCDFIDNPITPGSGGTVFLRPGGSLVITNSRIVGSSAGGKGRVAWIDAGSSMRIVGSTIMNTSGDAAFAIHDESGTDFAVQLDSVVVDQTVNIFSNSSTLLQNCDGFGSASVKKATFASCASTSEFCVPTSCLDTSAGIDCICEYKGVEVPFPTDCMQSAVIAVPIPSTRTLTYLIPKPLNESAELLLANVSECNNLVLCCVTSGLSFRCRVVCCLRSRASQRCPGSSPTARGISCGSHRRPVERSTRLAKCWSRSSRNRPASTPEPHLTSRHSCYIPTTCACAESRASR